MTDETERWRVFTGDQLDQQPPEVRRQVEEALRQVPIADVCVQIYNPAPGQSQVQIRVEPDGPFAAANPEHPDRETASDDLLFVVERELRAAVAILCRGR